MTWLEEEIPAALETPEVGETVEQLAYEVTDLAEEHIRPYADRIDRLRQLIDASTPPDEPAIPDELELDANEHVNEPSDLPAEIERLDGILEILGEGES